MSLSAVFVYSFCWYARCVSFKITGWFFWIYFLNKLLAAAAAAPLNGDFFFLRIKTNRNSVSVVSGVTWSPSLPYFLVENWTDQWESRGGTRELSDRLVLQTLLFHFCLSDGWLTRHLRRRRRRRRVWRNSAEGEGFCFISSRMF